MPDRWCLILSSLILILGVMFFLFPGVLLNLSKWWNRLATSVSDEHLLRYRYLVGLLCFLASYGLFKLALLAAVNPLTLLVH